MSQPSAMPTPTVLIIGLGLLLLALLTVPFTPFVKLLVGVLLVVVAYSALRSRAQARLSEQRVEALVGELQERVARLEREVRVLRLQGATAPAAPRPAEALPAQPPAALSAGLPAARSAVAEPPNVATPEAVPALDFSLPADAAAPGGMPSATERATVRATIAAAAAIEANATAMTGAPALASSAPARASTAAMSRRARAADAGPPPPSMIDRGVAAARDWLLGGNTVARVGLLVLFVGVAFLLRYVAERTAVPIELRLAGVALGGVVFLVLGWRMRERRPGFAVTLQGGAIGILYLTAFAALRLYEVLPPVAAFAFMAALAALSAVLAVLQDARALAALGATGGFLAPLLVATGSGRIELLFSYYLVLNLGVLGVALFRAWRELNWIAFGFTFGVSGLWAVQRYSAADYPVGQGFLAAFWLLFLAVSLLYALRQPAARRGLVDTLLVFALPLVAFGIQTRFTQGLDLALAALVPAAVYLSVAMWLLRQRDASLQLLAEASFALGVGFLTLAVPLAASAQWTSAAWALEGVAMLWVGLRQRRLFPTAAGLLLHVAGAMALLLAAQRGALDFTPVLSGTTLNLAVLAACAFASGWLLARAAAWRADITPLLADGPWLARLLGWLWVVLLLWQPLAFPWYVLAWCVLALVLVAAVVRKAGERVQGEGEPAPISPEWWAGVLLVLLATFAAELRVDASTAHLQLTLRLALAVTAVAAALLSLRGGHALQRGAAAGLLTLGVLAWLVALLAETIARVDAAIAVAQLALVLVGVTALALSLLGRHLKWSWPQQLAQALFAAHLVLAAYVVFAAVFGALRPSAHFGWAVWPAAWGLFYLLLHRAEHGGPRLQAPVAGAVHVAALWLLVLMFAAELALRVDAVAGGGWFHATWGAVLALALWVSVQHALRWPLRAAPFAYASVGVPGLAAAALAWLLVGSVRAVDAAPLPSLPLLNPLDLAALLVLAALARWHIADTRAAWQAQVRLLLAGAAFFVINLIALRAVHLVAGVPWTVDALARSLLVQAMLSLLWTVVGMALMVLAHRRAVRPLWMAGAALLAVVVAKLFFVDLSGQGTLERIVSFVGVGLLLILVGYLAPVPPAARQGRAQEEAA
jgi:uncharacterized membrane protein